MNHKIFTFLQMLPNHLPDHLLHRSSPARVLLPAHGAFGHSGPADGTDKVAISTVEYLEVGSHFIKADGALWDIWCTWSRRCGGIHLQKLDLIWWWLRLLAMSSSVSPLLFLVAKSTPGSFFISFTHSKWPRSTASITGVFPSLFFRFSNWAEHLLSSPYRETHSAPLWPHAQWSPV